MKRVCLFNLEQVGVVWGLPSEVCYFNHVKEFDGQPSQRELEGVFVPLSNDAPEGCEDLLTRLAGVFEGGVCPGPALCDAIDEVLAEVSSSDLLSVNRSRVAESAIGWVHLLIESNGQYSQFDGFGRGQAVLTWPLGLGV